MGMLASALAADVWRNDTVPGAKLIPLGQLDAHRLLARALDRVPEIAVLAAGRDVESFAPAMDISQMTHQYVHSRLFRS